MGGLKALMPITYVTAVVGALALAGIPPFAGFFSKDAIIEAVHASDLPGAGFAYVAVTAGVFVTAFYTFRLIIMTFHGKFRGDEHAWAHAKESPWVVTMPLIMLAIPSFIIGAIYFQPMLFGGLFGESLKVLPEHDTLGHVGEAYHGHSGVGVILTAIGHGLVAPPFWLAVLGIATAFLLYAYRPDLPEKIKQRARLMYTLLVHKYGFDELYEFLFAGGARQIGRAFWRVGDERLIDGLAVNGTARVVGWLSGVIRHIQSGLIYHYVFAMIIGLFLLMTWFLRP